MPPGTSSVVSSPIKVVNPPEMDAGSTTTQPSGSGTRVWTSGPYQGSPGAGGGCSAVGAPAMAIVWKVETLAAPAIPDRFCGHDTIREPASTGQTLLPVMGVAVPARTKRYRMAVPSIGDAVGQ